MPGESSGAPRGALPPLPALDRIATLLRHIDDELATMRHELYPDRLLAVVDEGPGSTTSSARSAKPWPSLSSAWACRLRP